MLAEMRYAGCPPEEWAGQFLLTLSENPGKKTERLSETETCWSQPPEWGLEDEKQADRKPQPDPPGIPRRKPNYLRAFFFFFADFFLAFFAIQVSLKKA